MSGGSQTVIRESGVADIPAIERLYAAAFPEEDLLPLLRDLLGLGSGVLSLVAEADGAVAGHVAVTPCAVGGGAKVGLLGPLAVQPAQQRIGIGRALVEAAIDTRARDGTARLCVLGDPAYYGRFGFAPETAIAPPYPLPDAWRPAWQSIALDPRVTATEGQLQPPAPWLRRELWSP